MSSSPSLLSSTSMESLQAFLSRTKQVALQHLKGKNQLENGLVIVMGNEAGDLDSLASSISLSYFLTHLSLPQASSSTSSFNFSTPIYVPLLQLTRSDLSLRQENLALLSSLSISTSDLLFLDELSSAGLNTTTSQAFSPKANTFLALVDHPSLSTRFGGPSRDTPEPSTQQPSQERKVVLIVDHHQDENSHPQAAVRIIKGPTLKDETSGSAISLIIHLFKDQLNGSLPKELVYLGLGATVIDTDNLKQSPFGKALPLDLVAHKILLGLSGFVEETSSLTSSSSSSPLQSLRLSLASFQSSSILSLPSVNLENSPPPSDDESSSVQERPTQAIKTHEFWKILSGLKAQVGHLTTKELLKRDLKTLEFVLPDGLNLNGVEKFKLKLSFSSVPLGLSEWVHKTDWEKWWNEVENWMKGEGIHLTLILNSFRERKIGSGGKAGSERGKHRRELIVVYLPPSNISPQVSTQLFQNFLAALISDSHASPANLTSRLLLEYPWKGVKLDEGEKKEKVSGIEAGLGGRRIRNGAEGEGQEMFGMVFKQTNQKANRKVVVPATLHALKEAVEKTQVQK